MIAHKIIDCSLCPTKVPYNDEVPWSETDNLLFDNFCKLHTRMKEYCDRSMALLMDYYSLKTHVEEVRAQLLTIAEAIKEARTAATAILPAFRLKVAGPAAKFSKLFNEATDAMAAFDIELRILGAAQKKLLPIFNKFVDQAIYGEDEEAEATWEAVSELGHKLVEDGHSIDFLGFDLVDDSFKGTYSYHRHRWTDGRYTCLEILHSYSLLMEETRVQYSIWEEFAERVKLIADIQEEHAEKEQIKLN